MADLDPETCLRADFPEFVAEHFKAGKAINEFLRKAVGV
jgi:hypothetical protein